MLEHWSENLPVVGTCQEEISLEVHTPGTDFVMKLLIYTICLSSVALGSGPAPDGSQRHWGCFLGGSGNVLAANLVWILVIFGWTFGLMVPFFYILKLCGLLRLSAKEEEVCASPMPLPSTYQVL